MLAHYCDVGRLKTFIANDQCIIVFCLQGIADELPAHFVQSLSLEDGNDSYDKMIHKIVGFCNPHCVNFLTDLLGLDERNPPSLLRTHNR